jgi:anion-transporting  ArsA/GET3 family ATPase
VANPEALVVNQVKRMIAALAEYQLPIHGLIINCVIEGDESGSMAAMQKIQMPYIQELKELAEGKTVAVLPRSITEIRGTRLLREIGERLVTGLAL